MNKSIEELVKDRKELVQAHKKNNFTDGIKALLTDLYPDTAHFIYELLQNAEDMNATIVRFILRNNKIMFEHNGTKRDFNLHDIDAITNIGHNSQKKNDPTTIGKFGVGFKAVFAYTSTPEIHSGKYHFKIKEYFIPEFAGVEEVPTIDEHKVKWTKFILPFNNPKKPRETAVKEITESLEKLNESSILFLNNIRRIEIILPKGLSGYVERDDSKAPFVEISYKPLVGKKRTCEWLKYSENISMIDDQGNNKDLNIAVAYGLEKTNGNYKIIPIDGKVFIYFPAEKEYSDLRFHINAPFASTVARDSVRNCSDNVKLIEKVADLMVNSISSIKKLGLLDMNFLEVLPHNNETMEFYNVFFKKLYKAFQDEKYLPTKYGYSYVSASNAINGPISLSSLFGDENLRIFFIYNKKWVNNALKNTRADKFIRDLNIKDFSYKQFRETLRQSTLELEKFIDTQNNAWLSKFYKFCDEVIKNTVNEFVFRYRLSPKEEFINVLRNTKLIRSSSNTNKNMYRPNEIFLLPPNVKLVNKNTPIVEKKLYSDKVKMNHELYDFIHKTLGVEEYGQKIEIENLIKKYDGKEFEINNEYFNSIMAFAEYNNENKDNKIDFSKYALFVGEKEKTLHRITADKIILSDRYHCKNGKVLLEIYDNDFKLWDGYYKKYNKKELEVFLQFVKECSVREKLEIVDCDVHSHPLYYEKLASSSNRNAYEKSQDYTIESIEKILSDINITKARLIWSTLKENNKTQYAIAHYTPNKSTEVKECDSTLFFYLKNNAWIPNRNKKFFKPGDIEIDDLYKGFEFNENDVLIGKLEIGSSLSAERKMVEKLELEAEKLGKRLISSEEAVEFEKYLKAKNKKKKSKESFDFNTLKEELNKDKSILYENNSIDDSIGNVEKRERKIEETFEDAKKMSKIERTISSKISISNKTEKVQLEQWYAGRCQICDTTIEGFDGKKHFEAINIFNSAQLPDEVIHTFSIGWNSLCLCPNCAMKYRVSSKKMNQFFADIDKQEVFDDDYGFIYLNMELDGIDKSVKYVPKHFVALNKAIKILKKK